MNRNTVLPILLTLAGGMAVGSIHNGQSRGALPALTTPFGIFLIVSVLLIFVAGIVLLRYYDRPGSVTFRSALIFAGLALFFELMNAGATLAEGNGLAGWLFHEYLGAVVAVLQFGKLLVEKRA